MNDNYDLIIIGSGPSGLSLAQCLRNTYRKILIIEKLDIIGGCHKVVRDKDTNLFTEHGPRIYSDSYKNFQMLLQDMNQDFFNLFVPYNFSISEIGGQTVFTTLKFTELLKLSWQFFLLILNNNHGKDRSLKEFMEYHNFNEKSIDMIDRIARLTDGAGADRYTVNEFLQIFNQQFFHKLYQPNKPNDEGFLKIWKEFLEKEGVNFKLNTEISKLNLENGKIKSVSTDTTEIYGKNFVLAMPPESFIKILDNSDDLIKNSFMDFKKLDQFSEATEYNEYICITFHWYEKITLPKVYGFPRSEWGIAFIVLSDYMDLSNDKSKTLISCAITIPNSISSRTNKTANEISNKNEIINETLLQLKEAFPQIPNPDKSILYSGNYYDDKEKKWSSNYDEAFITTSNKGFLPFSGKIDNLYNVGTHNGKQKYKFTSLESAVTNGIYLSHILNNDLKKKYPIQDIFSLRDMILIIIYTILLIICIFVICNLYIKNNCNNKNGK